MVKGNYAQWIQPDYNVSAYKTAILTLKGGMFAFLGMILGVILLIKNKQYAYFDRNNIYCILAVFIAGLCVALPISMAGSKWGLSRFLVPGYYLILLLLVFSLCQLMEKKLRNFILILIVFLSCRGPLDNILFRFKLNFPDYPTAIEKFEAVFSFDTMVR
jgi:hypothetical protein